MYFRCRLGGTIARFQRQQRTIHEVNRSGAKSGSFLKQMAGINRDLKNSSGAGFANNLNLDIVDDVELVSSDDAFEMAKLSLEEEFRWNLEYDN